MGPIFSIAAAIAEFESATAAAEAYAAATDAAAAAGAATEAGVASALGNLAGAELAEVSSLLGAMGLPGAAEAASAGLLDGAGTLGDTAQFFSNLITDEVVSEEVGIELTQMGDITQAELEASGITASEMAAVNIETEAAYEGITLDAKGMYQALKQLGETVMNRLKLFIQTCKKNLVTGATCAIGLEKIIRGLYKHFFDKTMVRPNIVPDFSKVNSFNLGVQVSKVIGAGLQQYSSAIIQDPSVMQDESKVDNLMLKAFKTV